MLALEQEGLVRIVARQGYFATELSLSDVIDAYQLRYVLEPIVTALAATRAGEADIVRLRALAAYDADGADDEIARAIQANKAFHLAVAEVAGNPRYVRILADVLDALGRLAMFDLRYWRTPGTWRDEHLAITEAIAAHDPVRAAAVDRATFGPDEGLLLRRTRDEIGELLRSINQVGEPVESQLTEKEE
jgi:DNA-binding GntR family transcriptional regulator